MTASGTPPRALYASAVLVVLVAALLAVWFYSGWHDVRARHQEVRRAPRQEADERANALARWAESCCMRRARAVARGSCCDCRPRNLLGIRNRDSGLGSSGRSDL